METNKEIAWAKTSRNTKSTSGETWGLSPEKAWICFEKYGDTKSLYGWEIDHWDGDPNNNDEDNIRAMQCINRVSKGKIKKCYTRQVYADLSQTTKFVNRIKPKKMCLTYSVRKDK